MKIRKLLWVVMLLLCTSELLAEKFKVGGHLKTQSNFVYFAEDTPQRFLEEAWNYQQDIDLRLDSILKVSAFTLDVDGEFLALGGAAFAANKNAAMFFALPYADPLPDDKTQLFDLTAEPFIDREFNGVARLDRFSLSYQQEELMLRLGRQALTLGNGLVFHALDLFSPFSPLAIDKDYKSGTDMAYLQYLLPEGDDLQLLAVPRRARETGNIKYTESSFALNYQSYSPCLETNFNLLLAKHYGESLLGAGFSSALQGAVLRADLLLSRLEDKSLVPSFIVNLDYSFSVLGRNLYSFIEYFHSGLGESSISTAALNDALTKRITRGELFVTGRDYLAPGLQLEVSPLFNLYITKILNLHDLSGYLQIRAVYDLMQDLQLMIGLNLPQGKKGDEFGAQPLGATGFVSEASLELYTRLSYYY